MTELQFLDADAINALLTALTLKPDTIVFFYDPADISKRCAERVVRTIRSHLPLVKTRFIRVNRLDMEDVREKFLAEVRAVPKEEKVIADITGGTEIMTACFLSVCVELRIRAVYAKLPDRKLFDILTGEAIMDTAPLTLSDYLSIIGAEERTQSRIAPEKNDFGRFKAAAEYVFRNVDVWYELYSALSRLTKHYYANVEKGKTPFSFRIESVSSGEMRAEVAKMVDVFTECDFLRKKDQRYFFRTKNDRERLTTFGIWLELYVYILASGYFDETRVGFRIDWDEADGEETSDNEIDVVAMKDSIPYFISCKLKTGGKAPTLPELYEVAYLAYRFGGDNARAILASNASYTGEEARRTNSLYHRYEKLRVGRIDVNDLFTKSAEEIFGNAVRMTERNH